MLKSDRIDLGSFGFRIKNTAHKKTMSFLITAFIVFMVIGRLVSGVHWFTDIIGGALLSAGLVALYRYAISLNLKGFVTKKSINVIERKVKGYQALSK